MSFDILQFLATHGIMLTEQTPSFRAQLVARRTYQRPIAGTDQFETWADVAERVRAHQQWLWERALGRSLHTHEAAELQMFKALVEARAAFPAGRTLWLGGTDVSKRRSASMLNCTFSEAFTVHDIVDIYWLLLQGAGTGFEPRRGALSGFLQRHVVEVVRSQRTLNDGLVGRPDNHESIKDGVWRISVGDSAEAWAKLIGKLLAGKHAVGRLVIDMREIRAAGERLGSYGWISSGDNQLAQSVTKLCQVLNERHDQLLSRIDILDIVNLLGETLSSRRSAQIALMPSDDPEAETFAMAKKDCWTTGRAHRGQSNNSLLLRSRPTKAELRGFFATMLDAGGSEPGFINAQAAMKRAPWFAGVNPCAEQLLANGGVCNLTELVMPRYADLVSLQRAVRVIARANYRATCVDLDDGILQRRWHEINEHLHLCGVGLTGIDQWLADKSERQSAASLNVLKSTAWAAAKSMAHELGRAAPKHVTTVKPSGTLSKVSDCTEGVHQAIGPKVINTIMLSAHDPLVAKLRAANYRVDDHPQLAESVLVRVPVHMPGATATPMSAVAQLDRYALLMRHWCDANCSVTVSYDQTEVRDIVEWLHMNWDTFVGVSFLPRVDATKTAEELGYAYLPQAIVPDAEFDAYAASLLPIDLDDDRSNEVVGDDCASGACPVR
jgi:ribonucleoside-triphosphate reductase